MDRLILAYLSPDLPLTRALPSFLPGTRAVVTTIKAKPALVTASDVMEEMNDALDAGRNPSNMSVGECSRYLTPAQAPTVALPESFALISGMSLTVSERQRLKGVFPSFAGSEDQRFAIQHLGPTAAVVVTASERFTRALGASITICTCEGNPVHTCEKSKLRVPGKCNKPHAAKVTCAPVS